ncbi:hypothetical protein [Haliangium ochraceum]|uniref:Yip1 domain-containing protein n=1 Tax=Haliangium ochraceum (strain DSM 14365 / JCM 11303 / SMP-2) TaxID=502025 RepID=D0LHQ0_HALO1|nr:hypothetical protein [Haliangium ochraceum]ACY12912.1 conserved hypothetical protein [Haliangium ochraceum DSM 14365]
MTTTTSAVPSGATQAPGRAPSAPLPAASWRDMLLATLAGPVALGAVLGLEVGPLTALLKSLALPAVLLGVAAVMVPALYVGATLTGAAPPAHLLVRSLGRGFRACGLVMLGLVAPALFLLATTQALGVAALVGTAATAAGVLIGLRVLFTDLFRGRSTVAIAAFALWSLVALGIGLRLFVEFVAA